MKRIMNLLAKDIKGTFVHSLKYIDADSAEIRSHIEGKIAEQNCARVLTIMPLFFVLAVWNIVEFSVCTQNYVRICVIASCAGLIFALGIYAKMMISTLYYSNLVTEKKAAKLRKICWSFWWIWKIIMLFIAFFRMTAGIGRGYYVFIGVITSFAKMYREKDFWLAVVDEILFLCVLWVTLLVDTSIFSNPSRYQSMLLVTYICAALAVIGLWVQKLTVKIQTLQEYIQIKAFYDPLTSLLNRRGGNARVEEYMGARKTSIMVGVIMLDIDYFKKYNDMMGHDEGDKCLRTVGMAVKQAVAQRQAAVIRHGGEEFVVLLFDLTIEQTLEYAERIRSAVSAAGLQAPFKEVSDVVTVSVGCSTFLAEDTFKYEDVLKDADTALYQAKNAGRNRVVLYRDLH